MGEKKLGSLTRLEIGTLDELTRDGVPWTMLLDF